MSFTQYVARLDITPGPAYAPFWSAFIQVLRNTMDHEARQARGQSPQSSIRVSTCVTSDQFTVVVEDDRPAADWAAVRNACESLDGSVEVESRDGGGTRISFAFPKCGAGHQRSAADERSRPRPARHLRLTPPFAASTEERVKRNVKNNVK
jgi:hypothetical protein